MSLPLTILALRDIWVYIGFLNSGDVIAHIEIPVNNYFSIATTLDISYVNPNDHYVRFQRNLDNSQFQY